MILVWFIHALLLLAIGFFVRDKVKVFRVVATLYLFYSVAPLIPFDFIFFQYEIEYRPTALLLFPYIVTDMVLLLLILYATPVQHNTHKEERKKKYPLKKGCQFVLIVAAIAALINLYFNYETIVLPKHIFFLTPVMPNLFYFTIPAAPILLGGMLFPPFRNKLIRYPLNILTVMVLAVLAAQGFRLLILILLLFVFFSWKRKGGVFFAVFFLTVVGEFSMFFKNLLLNLIQVENFDMHSWISYRLDNVHDFIGISSEQKAIAANIMLGLRDVDLGGDLYLLANFLPFSNRIGFVDHSATSSAQLGAVVGVAPGQGVAYNFQLFLVENFFIGLIFFILLWLLLRKFNNTIFTVLLVGIFYSILRNGPNIWSSEFKMFFILLFAACICSLFYKYIATLKPNAENRL